MRWTVNTRDNFGWGRLDLRIAVKNFDNSFAIVQPFTMKTREPDTFDDTVTISAGGDYDAREFLQACVDHAAELGIFPTNKAAPTKQIEALKYHLEDMRKLVFK
jgi:hypothetical protein